MTQSNVSEELLHLRKRARRRLVGAVALVIFALVVLWTVLDNAPPPQFAAGQAVEITSSAPALAAASAPVVAVVNASTTQIDMASAPVAASAPVNVASAPAEIASADNVLSGKVVNRQTQINVDQADEPKPTSKSTPAPKPEQPPKTKPATDPRRILEGLDDSKPAVTQKYFLQVGAFSDATKARQIVAKLKAEGLPAYAEKVNTSRGELTRVRVGPGTTEVRANEWRKKSEAAGVPGKVVKQ